MLFKPRRKRPRQFHHGDLREALLLAAERLVDDEGHHEVTLRRLAHSLGVTQPAVYRHFDGKDALLAAVGARGYAQMTGAVLAAADGARTPWTKTRAILHAYVPFAAARSGWFRLWHSRLWSDQLVQGVDVEARQRAWAPAITLLASATRPSAPVADLFRALWAAAHGAAGLVVERTFQLVQTDEERVAAACTAVDLVVDAIEARWSQASFYGSSQSAGK